MTETTINGFMQQRGQITLSAPVHRKAARRNPDLRAARGVVLGVLIGLDSWIVSYDVYLVVRWVFG